MKKNLQKSVLFLLVGIFALIGNAAEIRPLVEGEDYEVVAVKGSKTPEVMEFFNYACGHCYTMEAFNKEFKNKYTDIKFTPVPVELNPQWAIYVKAYYLGELLKVLDETHPAIFHQIHVEKKYIRDEDALKAFFLGFGVDSAQYDKANSSFALDSKIRKAKQLARKFKVLGTPTFVANSQYRLNNPSLGSRAMIEKALVELSKVKL